MELLDLYDRERARAVPVARYQPPPGRERAWMLFSVGFGGGREGYAYLARCWARAGLGVLVVEHVGSNLDALKPLRRPGQRAAELAQRVAQTVRDPLEQRQRVLDLAFVHSEQRLAAPWGLAGHSFGAGTVLRSALTMDAFAVVAMSPPSPAEFPYQPLSCPVLLVTGTRDDFAVSASVRMQALDWMAPERSALAVVEGADHMGLAGLGLGVEPVLKAVQGVTLDFLESALVGKSLSDPHEPGVQWRRGA